VQNTDRKRLIRRKEAKQEWRTRKIKGKGKIRRAKEETGTYKHKQKKSSEIKNMWEERNYNVL
jgi:hypothetical protein